MTEQGMKEVKNPSAIFLARTEEDNAGSLVVVLWEAPAQCWLRSRHWWTPACQVIPVGRGGLEQNRMAMLLAVLHRHGGLYMAERCLRKRSGWCQSERNQCGLCFAGNRLQLQKPVY